MYINGDQRIVDLDDKLPFNTKSKHQAMCYYERDASEFSLALIEKAYLKFYGEHFSPQNPSIDIHYLTNWIPETVYFDDLSNKESLWTRLLQNFRDQNIIICMQEVEGSHNYFYAVLDLIEAPGETKIIQCKSPYKGDKRLLRFIEGAQGLPIAYKVRATDSDS
jgi:hypothetical protein